MLPKLKDNKLYANGKNNDFARQSIVFLGHMMMVVGGKLEIKKHKCNSRVEAPSAQKNLRSFLGLANYYCSYI
jgi:hypothetical protein